MVIVPTIATMIKKRFADGSHAEFYENGDLVEIIRDDHYSTLMPYKKGEWGRVYLQDRKDRERGSSSYTSFVRVIFEGYSSPIDCFILSQKVSVNDLRALPLPAVIT